MEVFWYGMINQPIRDTSLIGSQRFRYGLYEHQMNRGVHLMFI